MKLQIKACGCSDLFNLSMRNLIKYFLVVDKLYLHIQLHCAYCNHGQLEKDLVMTLQIEACGCSDLFNLSKRNFIKYFLVVDKLYLHL